VAKGPGGHHGSELRAELARRNQRLPLLGDDDTAADRNYMREFVLAHDRQLGQKYGVEFAEAFHYIGLPASGMEDTIRQRAVPLK
jgi:predicted HTH domain antitoxin